MLYSQNFPQLTKEELKQQHISHLLFPPVCLWHCCQNMNSHSNFAEHVWQDCHGLKQLLLVSWKLYADFHSPMYVLHAYMIVFEASKSVTTCFENTPV